MAATVTELGARVLRRLGVVAVAAADRPSVTATSTVTDIAGRALQSLGIIVTAAERPALTGTVTVADLAERALEGLGVVVPESERPLLSTTATVTEIGTRALQHLGVAVAAADRPATATTSTVTDIAERALQSLGVVVPASARPAVGTALAADIAERALQNLGIVVPEADRPVNTATVTITALAERALQALDVPVPASSWPASSATTAAATIATEALVRLGVVASDETPSTTDQALALTAVTNIHETLIRRGLVTWALAAIPAGVAQDYALLAVLQLATSFGKQGDGNQRPIIEARIGWSSLVQRAQALAEARVTAIHAGLVAAGLAGYANSAIPASVAEPYVQLLTIELAPVFGKQADPGRAQQWEGMIRRDALTRRAQTDAVGIVAAVHGRLVALGIVDWASSAIPASVAEDYADLIANDYGPAAGVQRDRSGEQVIEQRIRYMAQVSRAQAVAEAKVAAIHEGLVRAGLAAYASTAIPRGLSEDYAQLVAIDLAPMFGGKADLAAVPGIEARIRRTAVILQGQGLAEARVLPVHEALVGQGLASWASSAIPRAVSDEYALLVAVELGPLFEKQVDRGLVAPTEARVGRVAGLLRAQAAAVDRVTAVHNGLVAQGLADWAITAVPASVSEAYVDLARFDLAPVFDRPRDAGVVPAAEAHVRRVSTISRAQALAEARATAIHEGLVAQGIASWSSAAIPRAISEDMVALVANEVAPVLGGKTDPAMAAGFEQRVRRVSLIIAGPALAEQAVRDVHDNLVARGKVRWSWADRPSAADRPYVYLAAYDLAPAFGMAQNQNDLAMATVDLNRLIALPTSGERITVEYF